MIPDWRAFVGRVDKSRVVTAMAVIAVSGVAAYMMQNKSPNLLGSHAAALPAPIEISASQPPHKPALITAPRPPVAEAEIMAPATALAAPSEEFEIVPLTEVTRSSVSPAQPILSNTAAAETEPDNSTVAETAPDCLFEMSATPSDAAMVALKINAPCHSGEEVDLISGGISFSEYLDPDGQLDMMFPSLMAKPVITVSFGDGEVSTVQTELPDFGAYNRIALTWQGGTGLQLHALENGAGYDDPGHVWAESPHSPEAAITEAGGFLSVLGSVPNGGAADIYTYPAAMDTLATLPEISVEVMVTENTCGTQISGNIFGSGAGLPMHMPLTIAMPGCDAVGQYLVLKNPGQEMKLAAE